MGRYSGERGWSEHARMMLVESEKLLLVLLLVSEPGNIAGNAFADHDNRRRQSKPSAGHLASLNNPLVVNT